MKLISLFTIAFLLSVSHVTAQTGPENLSIFISGGSIGQRPLPVTIQFSGTGSDAFNSSDTTSVPAINDVAVAAPDTHAVYTGIPESSYLVAQFDSIMNMMVFEDTAILIAMNNTNNVITGNPVLPFTVSSDSVIIDWLDSRPIIDRYTVYNFGLASDHADTITINASAFIDTASTNYSANKKISSVYLEDLTTGLFYSILDQNVTLAIPATVNFAMNYKLHIMVQPIVTAFGATCINPNGYILIENTNSSAWNYIIYRNGVSIRSSAVSTSTVAELNLQPDDYAVVVYVNNLLTDSVIVTVDIPVPIVPNFTVVYDTVNVNDNVLFTNSSSGSVTYSWDFGDSTSDSLENPTHSFGNVGTYPVTLTATNQYGCQEMFTDSIFVTSSVIPPDPNSFSTAFDASEYNNSSTARNSNTATIYGAERSITISQHSNGQQVTIEISNINGQLISSASVTDEKNVFQVPEAGIYLVKVLYSNGEMTAEKVLITN